MSEPQAPAVVEASRLSKVYWDGNRRLQVLKDVTFAVKRGEGIAIWGPSGSGKTTLLSLLAGLDRPDSGDAAIVGEWFGKMDEKRRAEWRRKNLGLVFQFYHLLGEFTATENVTMPLLLDGKPPEEALAKAAELLAAVGLTDRSRHFPGELSGGEQQRVAIARALANDPPVVFCDEPTGNLDPATGAEIGKLLERLFRERGKTLVVVTHDERIAALADRVWDIVKGDWKR